jgi:prepilin-type N-terminal cleavage/methylation domain-containing protein
MDTHNQGMPHVTRRLGFTIVELLIVIVVIAILAAIVIVAYNGVQQRARAAADSSALSEAAKNLALYQVDNGAYPADSSNFFSLMHADSSGTTTGGLSYQYSVENTASPQFYCVTATAGNVSYYLDSPHSAASSGGCPGHGQGGVAAITNLAANPSVEGGTTGWVLQWFGGGGGTGSATQSSSAAHCGANGYRKTWATQGNGQDVGYKYSVSAQAGKAYTASVALRSSFDTTMRIWIYWYDSTETQIGAGAGIKNQSASANTWSTISTSATAPSGTSSMIAIFGPYPSSNPGITISAGSTLDTDCLMITEGSTAYSFADGSSPNWVWNGASNSSTSTGPANP